MTPAQIRSQIQRTKNELARFEGEVRTQQAEIDSDRAKLQKTLGCQAGEVKVSIQKLKKRIEANQAKVVELLDQAEAVRDPEDENDHP